jgi:Cft2 family RNA processing exonuclease
MFSLAEKSIYVAALGLWIDSMRSRSRCYVSHGHSDHARIHETIVTTPHNAEVCKLRLGKRGRPQGKQRQLLQPVDEAPEVSYETYAYNQPWLEGEHRLTLFSAGHVLGSAQLLIEGERGRFVYTGDFKLGRAYTCEPAEVKPCDVLLMECTYGRPQYVFPSRDEVEDAMIDFAANALADGCAPVFYAYSLGKAQEAMAILGKAGIPLTAHGAVFNMARVYEACGVRLPPYAKYDALTYAGTSALIWPPSGNRLPAALRGKPARSAVLTGWAVNRGAMFQSGADAAFALSDHADFPALLRYLELAQPRKVLLNHGWRDFVWRLRRMGVDAEYLEENQQLALF